MHPGDRVPDLALLRPDGSEVALRQFLIESATGEAPRGLLVVFLRHLAWIACRAHLGEVQCVYPELQKLGVEVLVVSFTPPSRVAAYLAKYPQPFPVVSDPTLAAYRAFALERAPVSSLFRFGVIGRYLGHIFRGWMPRKPGMGEDILQLGGDFLLDGDGVVRYAHPSAEPTDRPSADALLGQARALSPKS